MSKAIFSFVPRRGFNLSQRLSDLVENEDFRNFLIENEGNSITMSLEESSLKSEKMRLYAFIHGPLIRTLMDAMRANGEIVDKVYCLLSMKVLYARDLWIDSKGQTHAIILSQSDMSFNRLLQFARDIIQHLEENYQACAPDTEYYLKMKNK